MNWQELQEWLDGLEDDGDVIVTILLGRFPDFPRHRLGGYVKPSGEPTVAVSHLQAVVDRYGDVDGDGHGGPSQSSDDEGLKIAHNTIVPPRYRFDGDQHGDDTPVKADEIDKSVIQEIKQMDVVYECGTTE